MAKDRLCRQRTCHCSASLIDFFSWCVSRNLGWLFVRWFGV